MNPTLAAALLAAALGLALSFWPRSTIWRAAAVFALVAVVAAFTPVAGTWAKGLFIVCWISVAATAGLCYLPQPLPRFAALAVAANAGLWAGLVIATGPARLEMVKALPFVLVCIPGVLLVEAGRGIILKVVASWIVAVAVLAVALSTVHTPGYAPDHKE